MGEWKRRKIKDRVSRKTSKTGKPEGGKDSKAQLEKIKGKTLKMGDLPHSVSKKCL